MTQEQVEAMLEYARNHKGSQAAYNAAKSTIYSQCKDSEEYDQRIRQYCKEANL